MTPATRLLVSISGLTLGCFAQELQLAGPLGGWVFDPPSRSIRVIAGMPGAARLGGAALEGVAWASVAPSGNVAIVQIDDQVRLFAAGDAARNTTGTPIGGAIEGPQLAMWSADSSAIALYSPAVRSVQWIRVDGVSATAEAAIPLTGVDGVITCMAADSASRRLILAVAGDGLYRVSESDGPVLLATVPDASAMAVEPGGRRLWVADRTNAQILEVLDRNATATVRTVIAEADRLQDVSAISPSPDRRTLYLADRRTNRLYSFDRKSGVLTDQVDLPVSPAAMIPLGLPSALLLGQRSQPGDPLYVLMLNADSPAVIFVPGGDAQ